MTAIIAEFHSPVVDRMIREECTSRGLILYRLLSGCRESAYTRCRRALVARLRTELNFSFPTIGRALGIDHTSAIYAWRKWLATDVAKTQPEAAS